MKKNILTCTLALCLMWANMLTAQNETPKDEMPNREERIYSLSTIWKELSYNFAYPETLRQANLDSLYMVFLPKVEQAKNNYQYYRVLSQFMAHFNEAHTRIYISQRPDDQPPLQMLNFGEKIIVSNIAKSMVEELPLGSEILKINNIPVVEYIKDSVYPYISAATSHWKFDKAVTEMMYGEPQSVVKITAKTPRGKETEVTMIRNSKANGNNEVMADTSRLHPIMIDMLDGNIGYIRLPTFVGQHREMIESVFLKELPQLKACKGLIIDIRGNRGGSDQSWEEIAYHLLPGSQFKSAGKWLTRCSVTTYRIWGEYNPKLKKYSEGTAMQEVMHPPYTNKLDHSSKLNQPLIVISGRHVASAAEDFLSLIKETGRATVVGEPSVGCMGEPMFVPLSGNYEVMFCAKKYESPDGTDPNEKGLLPDIEVDRSYNAYLDGRDNVLDRAIEELNKQIAHT